MEVWQSQISFIQVGDLVVLDEHHAVNEHKKIVSDVMSDRLLPSSATSPRLSAAFKSSTGTRLLLCPICMYCLKV